MNSPPPARASLPGSAGTHPALPIGAQALILDFDGTLADTTPSHEQALRATLKPYGVGLDPGWYRRHAGLSIRDLLAVLPGARHLPHDEIIRQSRARLLDAIGAVTPVECVAGLLRAARAIGLPCAVASGASRLLVRPGLAALGLDCEFAAVVAREDVPHGKPAPDLYAEAARRIGVRPVRCLAVDDAPDGVAAARAAGMRVLTVADGHLACVSDDGEGTGCPGQPGRMRCCAARAHAPLAPARSGSPVIKRPETATPGSMRPNARLALD